jgi:molybdate transport system permease protein
VGAFLSDPATLAIVTLSLQVSALAMAIVVPIAILLGAALAKPDWPGKALVSALVHLPLVTPPVVTGYALLVLLGRRGWVGQWLDGFGIQLAFSWVGAAIAAGLMALPLVVRPIRLAFETQDPRLVEMAATLGASRLRRFRTVVLPMAWPGIVAGLVLGFAKALGEFGATITFVGNIPEETQTLSLAIYTLLQSPSGDSRALILIGFAVFISFAAILGSELLTSWIARRNAR